MRYYVTGGAGFIGSGLVRALLSGGHEVMVVDDLSTGKPENLDPRAGFRKLDLLDDALAETMLAFAPDAVVHLAAQASVSASIADPQRDRAVNAEGTRRVAAAARQAGAARMLSASSAAVYGEPAELPLAETSPCAPINPYGASKYEAESLLAAELDGTGTDYASLRFANVYGPRQDAEGEGGVIAVFLSKVAQGLAPTIHGDGRQTRDFIYVGDVVGAIVSALNHEGSLAETGGVFNVSTGKRSSLLELVGAIRVAAGYYGAVDHDEARTGDIVDSVLDPSRAYEVFGWRANMELEPGVALTWRWFANRG